MPSAALGGFHIARRVVSAHRRIDKTGRREPMRPHLGFGTAKHIHQRRWHRLRALHCVTELEQCRTNVRVALYYGDSGVMSRSSAPCQHDLVSYRCSTLYQSTRCTLTPHRISRGVHGLTHVDALLVSVNLIEAGTTGLHVTL